MAATTMTTKGALTLAIALCSAGTALAQATPPPEQAEQAEQPAQQPNAQEAMQGGGMTDAAGLADATARGHFQIGTTRYDEGNFAGAAREFEEAYRLSNRIALMFNAYIAYRDANDTENAARCLRVYLDNGGDAVEERASLEARLRAMEEGLEEQRAREVELQRREREAAAAARAAQRRPRQPETWPWIVLGIGGAAVIAGAITGGLGLAEADSLAADCPGGVCDVGTDLDGRRSNIETLGITTDVLLFAGGAIALTGLILGLALGIGGGEPQPESESPEVTAMCGLSGCAASLRQRF